MAAAVGTDAFCWWISVLMIPRMISHLTAKPHAAQKKGTFIHIRYSLTLLRPRGRTYNKRENLPGRLEKAYIGTYCRVLARLPWTIFSQHGQRNENFMSKKWKKLVIISPVYDWCWGSQALSTLVGLLTEICFLGVWASYFLILLSRKKICWISNCRRNSALLQCWMTSGQYECDA